MGKSERLLPLGGPEIVDGNARRYRIRRGESLIEKETKGLCPDAMEPNMQVCGPNLFDDVDALQVPSPLEPQDGVHRQLREVGGVDVQDLATSQGHGFTQWDHRHLSLVGSVKASCGCSHIEAR